MPIQPLPNKLTGRILKGVAGIYTVAVAGYGQFDCLARGLFRKVGVTPLAGDMVIIGSLDRDKKTGYLHEILPRRNELLRPRAANVDQAMLVFAIKSPDLNTLVADAMTAYMEGIGVKPVICLNKTDLAEDWEIASVVERYAPAGYPALPVCAVTGAGLDRVTELLTGKVTILAGPSGVGKSSLINALFPTLAQETGVLSQRIQRGKNTTRQCQLFDIGDGYIADSPGFTAFDALETPRERLQFCFPEFAPYLGLCYYADCLHLSEHDCAVKEMVGTAIAKSRYDNYTALMKNRQVF